MPVDKKTAESFENYKSSLGELESVLLEYKLNNIIIVGDINANPFKKAIWKELSNFCDEYSLSIYNR